MRDYCLFRNTLDVSDKPCIAITICEEGDKNDNN